MIFLLLISLLFQSNFYIKSLKNLNFNLFKFFLFIKITSEPLKNTMSFNSKMMLPVTDQSIIISYETNGQKIDHKTKANSRIFKFSSEYSYNEILAAISNLKSQTYPNLFIFIIEDKNFEFSNLNTNTRYMDISILKICLVTFDRNRQMFLKLTSVDENESKFFMKRRDFSEFSEIHVMEFMNEIDDQVLKVLAENGEISINSETSPRMKIKEPVHDADMIDLENKNTSSKFIGITKSDDGHQSDQNEEMPQKATVNEKLEETSEDDMLEDVKNMINQPSYNADDLIVKMIGTHSKKVVELIISEISKTLNKNSENGFFNYLQHINKDSETIFYLIMKQKDSINLKTSYEVIKLFLTSHQLMDILCRQTTTKYENILQLAAKCDKIEFHEAIWEILINAFENREDLMELIMQKNRFGDNFVHYLVVHDKPDIIEFTISKLQEIFSPDQYQKILESKGHNDRNLLHAAAVSSKDIKTHQILWNAFKTISNPTVEFTEYLQVVDKNDNNIFHLAACFTTRKVFEFMILELENLTTHEKIKEILTSTGLAGKNLLQSAARQNYSVELHKSLWEIIDKFSGSFGLWGMIKHIDDFDDNVLSDVIECNTREVAEFIWNKVLFYMSNRDFKDLNLERFGGRDLLQLSLQNNTDPGVHDFCKRILHQYELLLNGSKVIRPVEGYIERPTTEHNIARLRQQQKSKWPKPPVFDRRWK